MAEDGRSGDTSWCLKRIGGCQERMLLPEGEEVSVGRGTGVTYQLTSALCPLMISRKHCIFKQNAEGQWMVTDNSSLNGVWLSKEKMEPQKAYILPIGGHLQLGVPAPNQDQPEFEYEVVQENLEHIRPFLTCPLPSKTRQSRTKRKFNCEDSEASGTEGTSTMSKAKVHRSSKEGEEPAKSTSKTELAKQPTVKAREEPPEKESSLDNDGIEATQQQQCQSTLHLSAMRQSIAELRSLNVQVQEKRIDMLKSPPESASTGGKYLLSAQQELQDLQTQLSSKRDEHLERMHRLKKTFHGGQQSKGETTEAKEEQLAQALKEHTLLMEELNHSHRDFEQIIQAKNKELQETKVEKEKVEAQKDAVLNHMNDVLDNELQCIICSEHIIEAVTLNCAHSFCSYCIQSWRKRKDECPICRQPITTQSRSLVLDNCISRMMDKLSQEMQDRRAALILERKDLAKEVISIPTDSDISSVFSDMSNLSSNDDLDELGVDSDDDSFDDSDDMLSIDSDDDDIIFLL